MDDVDLLGGWDPETGTVEDLDCTDPGRVEAALRAVLAVVQDDLASKIPDPLLTRLFLAQLRVCRDLLDQKEYVKGRLVLQVFLTGYQAAGPGIWEERDADLAQVMAERDALLTALRGANQKLEDAAARVTLLGDQLEAKGYERPAGFYRWVEGET